MHPNWTSALSVFSASKISRTASGSDARNIRLPESSSLDAIFGIQDTVKSEVLPSTSASIVKAGLNKVWRWPQSTKSLLALHAHSFRLGPGVPLIPLQKVPNEEQPGRGIVRTPDLEPVATLSPALQPAPASILTCLPSHKPNQPDFELHRSSASIFPQPVSGSVFSLQKVAKDEQPGQDVLHYLRPVNTSSHVPWPTAAPITHLPLPQTSQPEREPLIPANPGHPSGSRFLSISLQKDANEKDEASRTFNSVPQTTTLPLLTRPLSAKASQMEFAPNFAPKQNTISFSHALPSNSSQKQLAIKSTSLWPPSGSPFLRSPLQEVPIEQWSAQGPVSQLSPAQIFGSFTAQGSESPQQGVGLSLFAAGQDSFHLPPISSPYATQWFLSSLLPDTIPHEQSLLFLPPSPLCRRKINFNPFSPEKTTVPLPPASEPTSNQLGHPVRDLDDDELLISPLLLSNEASYLSLSPIQSSAVLSPLSIALLLSPQSTMHPPNELNIKIPGPEGYLTAESYEPHITHFLLPRASEAENALVVVWQQSHFDSDGARGMMSLKALFAKLNEKVFGSNRVALSSFSKLSITIPDLVKDVTSDDNIPYLFKEDDSIDLTNALDLLEFTWRGDFAVFGLKFNHLSMTHLTVLNVNSTHISFNDALQLLHSCPNARAVDLGTIQDANVCDFGDLRKPSEISHMIFGNLQSLTLESNVALHPFFEQVGWSSWVSLVLTLRQDAVVGVHTLPIAWKSCRDITFNSHLMPDALTRLKNGYPHLQYNDIGSQ